MKTNAKSGSGSDATSAGAFRPENINLKWPAQNDSLIAAMQLVIPSGVTVADIGAGAGNFVKRLRERGYRCWGFDGIAGVDKLTDGLVLQYDLTKPIQWLPPAAWAISIEVGEHIPRQHESQFLANLCGAATDGMIVTWATRSQEHMGRGHVNCLDPPEVAARLLRRGWAVHEQMTRAMHKRIRRPFRKKLLVFTRR